MNLFFRRASVFSALVGQLFGLLIKTLTFLDHDHFGWLLPRASSEEMVGDIVDEKVDNVGVD